MKPEMKLERPPYVHNWVRTIGPDLQSTVSKLVHLALGFPAKTYVAATPIIRDRIATSLDRETAMMAALTTGRTNSRQIVAEYVSAFFEYDEVRRYSGKPTFDEMVEPFRISKGLFVPVKPLINIVENGRVTPIFSVGWATYPLTKFQTRLLATVIEDAVFSLTDFRKSPGEFLCFPKQGSVRKPLVWNRGDVDLLSDGERRDCLEMYVQALEIAKETLRSVPERGSPKPQHKRDTDPNQFSLDV